MKIVLQVNHRLRELDVTPSSLLSDVLRDNCRTTSVHLGCEHGVCGACNVRVDGQVVRSCLTLAGSSEAHDIVTLEGLNDEVADALRTAFRAHHALQCGFCTPGMMVTAYDIVQSGETWTEAEIRYRLSGNICRCTGYQGIVAAIAEVVNAFTSVERQEQGMSMSKHTPFGIVGAAIVPHAPQFLSRPDTEDLAQVERVRESLAGIGALLRAKQPDCIVMISNDHGDHFVTHSVPPFCVHVATEADGMHRHRGTWAIDGEAGYALVPEMERLGFDLAFTMNARLQTAFTIPFEFMGFDRTVPLLTLFVNAYVAPQPGLRRCHAFGEALATALERMGKRALVIASGGLSHYPGTVHYPHPDIDTDRQIFAELQAGRLTHLLSYDDWEADRSGNVELRSVAILAGAIGNVKPFTTLLEPSWHHTYASMGFDLEAPRVDRDPLRYPRMPSHRAKLVEAVLALRTSSAAARQFLSDGHAFCAAFGLKEDESDALRAMKWEQLRDDFGVHALLTSGAAMQIGLVQKASS